MTSLHGERKSERDMRRRECSVHHFGEIHGALSRLRYVHLEFGVGALPIFTVPTAYFTVCIDEGPAMGS